VNNEVARLVSVNIGRPKPLPDRSKNAPSSIFKTSLEGMLRIVEIRLEGDAQAELAADRDCW
jgi:MOSC domain-containing protein YiiM